MTKEPKKESEQISRREFIKETGIILGGVAIASSVFASACNSLKTITQDASPPTSSTPPSTAPATSSVSASTVPATSSTSSNTPSATSVNYANYLPSTVMPQLLAIPNCTTKAAVGYLYSTDNMWVLQLSNNIGVVGMTDKFQALVSYPKLIDLPQTGATVTAGQPFGSIEGSKLNSDLTSPVTGLIIDVNSSLITLSNSGSGLEPIIDSPYVNGWMIVVQMSNPSELNSLLTAQQYTVLVANLE